MRLAAPQELSKESRESGTSSSRRMAGFGLNAQGGRRVEGVWRFFYNPRRVGGGRCFMTRLFLRRPHWTWCGLVLALMVSAGCTDASDGPAGSPIASTTMATATVTSTPQDPVGIIAIGHSALTGNNADPARPGKDTKELSWATGTMAEVNSIYRRLVTIRPETEGNVFNAAVGGAASDTLPEQAEVALAAVPAPAIVIVETIDNDIRCDGNDAGRVGRFGENVGNALRVITEASPQSRILMLSSFGRPDAEIIGAIIAVRPDLKRLLTGTGVCDFYNPAGELAPEGFAGFISILESFEAEQARVCATVPQCSTDGGAATRFEDTIADYSDDYIHLNVGGLARLAEAMWPVVEALVISS